MAARLVAISLVVGLFIPMPEEPDASKRMKGEDGIKACDAALNGQEKAHDGGRRLELILGRSIHRMEIADWQGAIDDLHTLPNDQPALTSTRAYAQSLAHTAAYLEAISLVSKGDFDGAIAIGNKIATDSPYDIYTTGLAYRLMSLTDAYTPEKKQLLDQMVRLNPQFSITRATALSAAGDFSGAGDDYSAYADLVATIPDEEAYEIEAAAAIAYRLGGNAEKADALVAAAQPHVDADAAAGKHTDFVNDYHELSDFYAIVVALDNGQTVRARNMFSAHSHWLLVNHGFVAELAKRLQSVGTPEEQAISPIQTPDQIRSEHQKTVIANITSQGDKGDKYWSYFIPANSDAAYAKLASSVWNSKNSKYISKSSNAEFNSQYVNTSTYGVGVPCAYALYMHLAVAAKSQGKSGFMIVPGQKNMCADFFRIGNPGDKDMIAPFMMNADQVIADLSTYFPAPYSQQPQNGG
jgi:nucleoid-associated protein YgaU